MQFYIVIKFNKCSNKQILTQFNTKHPKGVLTNLLFAISHIVVLRNNFGGSQEQFTAL